MRYDVSPDLSNISLNEKDPLRSILQNVAIVLATRRGTCPMYRRFGLSEQFLDRPVNVAKTLMFSDIKEAVEEYEPRVEVVGIDFTSSATEPGRLIPIVTVEVISLE